MKLIIKCGKWIFEIKQIFARKTDDFGDDFTASLVINNSNGTAKIELAINKSGDSFTRQDRRDLQEFFKLMGFENVTFDRFKNGKQIEVKKIV
jgi:hypothetical protein